MRARLGQTELPNLVLAAAGCAGAGRELAQFIDVARVGALISKSIMAEPHTGNPAPRLAETPSGLLNSVGLQNPGIDAFLQRDLPWLLSRGARVVVSIAGQTIREYAGLAARLSDTAGVTAIEVNLSCPNAEDAGQAFAFDPQRAGSVIAAVRGSARYDIPVFAKLSPDVTDIVAVASACVASGADGLSLINTMLGMVIDPVTVRPMLAGRYGGGAMRVAGEGRVPGRADHRDGRRAYRPGRPGTAARGRVDDRGGHRDHARPVGVLARAEGTGRGTGGPRSGPGRGRDRAGPRDWRPVFSRSGRAGLDDPA
jgi:dihydroorotate dehydrogenase subfamily 1